MVIFHNATSASSCFIDSCIHEHVQTSSVLLSGNICYGLLLQRLAIYYLNTVSKAYQKANMDLKRKIQMVCSIVLFVTFHPMILNDP